MLNFMSHYNGHFDKPETLYFDKLEHFFVLTIDKKYHILLNINCIPVKVLTGTRG